MSWRDRSWADEPRDWTGGPGLQHGGLFVLMAILAACYVVPLLLGFVSEDLRFAIEKHGGLSREGLGRGFLWQPVTYQFLHGGPFHLFFNLLFFFIWARLAVGLFGTRRLIVTIIACGAVGGVLDRLMPWNRDQDLVVGFSGSLNAMFGLLLVAVPNLPLNVIFFVTRLKWLVLVFVGLDLLMLLETRGESRTALGTHLFGFGAGVLWMRFGPSHVEPWFKDRARRKRRKAEVKAYERAQLEEQELDRILKKINEEGGMSALSDRERTFLRRRAEKTKNRR